MLSQSLPQPIAFGRYTLFERIGRGGMAEVFKGRIQGPGGFERVMVIKRILPTLTADPAFVRMLIEEAKLSARLVHPNIVQVFELGAVDGEYFIAFEHVPGHDLAETARALWKRRGAPRPELVAYIGREMCRALAYAHTCNQTEDGRTVGMIHRDVSPSNVMLSTEGAVKLLDFGIAKVVGETAETTKTGAFKGKFAYMAPEQIERAEVDARVDIFAAGIVLHEVLTGRRLFKRRSDAETLERVRRCEVRPPSESNPLCPPALDAIVLRALARDRDQRFATAAEMADALDGVVHAAHFTPEQLATLLRELFPGGDGGAVPLVDRRVAVSSPVASRPRVRASASGPSPPPRAARRAQRWRRPDRRSGLWIGAALCATAIAVIAIVTVSNGAAGGGRSASGLGIAVVTPAAAQGKLPDGAQSGSDGRPVAAMPPPSSPPAVVAAMVADSAPAPVATTADVEPLAVAPSGAAAPARVKRPGRSGGKARRRADLGDPFTSNLPRASSAVLVDPFCDEPGGGRRSRDPRCPAPTRSTKRPPR